MEYPSNSSSICRAEMQHAPDSVILAGGQGRRLRSVLQGRPKPLAPVRGRPFLGWLLRSLARQGIERVVLSTGYRAPEIQDFVDQERRAGDLRLQVVCVSEARALGTGGGLRNALAQVQTPCLLVLNGDSYFPFDLGDLMRRHRERRAIASLMLAQVADADRFGTVEIDDQSRIAAFREKAGSSGRALVNAGVYLLEREVVTSIPSGRQISLEREVFPSWIGKGLYGVVGAGYLVDIGTPESYAAADSSIDWEELTPTGGQP